jgi:hypothetical protein
VTTMSTPPPVLDPDAQVVKVQSRRKVTLETLSLVVPLGSALFFSGLVIADWTTASSAGVAMATAVLATGFWLWHRSNYPANIAAPQDDGEVEDEEDDDGKWDLFTVALLAVCMFVVVTVGLLMAFWLPLVVIVLFTAAAASPDLSDLLLTVGLTLAVSFILEFAVVMPLSRRWNLSTDEDPRPLSDFCPTPTDPA